MKQYRILFTIFILAVTACTNSNKDLSVMSFHIKQRSLVDGVNSWENRKPLVLWLLKDKEPDIIGFQVVDKNQLVNLLFDLPQYRYVGDGSNGELDPGPFNPIFFKKDEFDLIAKSQFWLSENPELQGSKGWDSDESNIVSWVKLRNRNSGHIFFVFNTCFSELSSESRLKSAKLILQKINMIADNAPVIVTGTINETPQDSAYHILTGNYEKHFPLWDSETIAEITPDEPTYTYNAFSESTQLKRDYILVNGYLNVNEFMFFPSKKGKVFISNHYPIMVNLTFNSQIESKDGQTKILR
jgi:endonuclease/exonuclease/phosphatase family metal-dependent hydrolase